MSRRYGRVSLEGWIDEAADLRGHIPVYANRDGDGETNVAATVEWLPAPDGFTFADGDVVRFVGRPEAPRYRVSGHWFSSAGLIGGVDDAYMAARIAAGSAVRLVPEVLS